MPQPVRSDPAVADLAATSTAVIAAAQAPTGAYPAAPTYPVYGYCWFRDGSFVAEAMSRSGHPGSAEAFFGWCARVLTDRAARIEGLVRRADAGEDVPAADCLPTRYTLDGQEATGSGWWDFQLDGYGTWLWALREHVRRHGRSPGPYREAVVLTVRYLTRFWDRPCYDWWEEFSEHRHVSTLGAVHAGLRAAADLLEEAPDGEEHPDGTDGVAADGTAEIERTCRSIRTLVLTEGTHAGRLAKWLGGDGVDASLAACVTPFGLLEDGDPLAKATITAVETELAHGGVHRYPADTFYGGGEWPVLTGLLGWHHARVGRTADAEAALRWIVRQATPAGELPEQVSGHLLHPDRHREWVARWGPVATPLLWSHAMFLILADALGDGPHAGPEDAR